MASQRPPLPPPAKSPPPAPTNISALGEDLLREVFLRFPSLPSLVRAALTCRTFLRAVRSSPAFRRRFRALHPPPLLGIFQDIYGPAIPAFSPLRCRSDPDLAAAVHGADFFLTRLAHLPGDKHDPPEWSIDDDCHHGYVILANWNTSQIAAYNPLTRDLVLFPKPPDEVCCEMYVEFHIISSEEDHGSSRIVCVCHGALQACVGVFSPETKEWQMFPWVEFGDDEYWQYGHGTLVNGFVYWTDIRVRARVLNTETLQFSRIDLPPFVEGQEWFMAGQTKDGKICIACTIELTLVVWFWGANDDGVERWMLNKTFQLEAAIAEFVQLSHDHVALKVVAVIDGFVYLSTYYDTDACTHCWFLSFCLETMELNKLCPILTRTGSYPYIMAWPSSLVRDKVNPGLEGA